MYFSLTLIAIVLNLGKQERREEPATCPRTIKGYWRLGRFTDTFTTPPALE